MKNHFLSLLFLCCAISLSAQSYDDVAIIVNTNSEESIAVAYYFIIKHDIPVDRVIEIGLPTDSVLDSMQMSDVLEELNPMIAELQDVNYILTTKGCPHGVDLVLSTEIIYSFESVIKDGLLTASNYNFPTYAAGAFDSDEQGFYIVSRLEAKTIQGTYDLIDRAGMQDYGDTETLVLDHYESGPQSFLENVIYNVFVTWESTNNGAFNFPINRDTTLSLYNENTSNLGYYGIAIGSMEAPQEDIDRLLQNTKGVTTFLGPGTINDGTGNGRLTILDFLENNCHAGIGNSAGFFLNQSSAHLDFYKQYFNLQSDYNVGEAFYLNERLDKTPYVLFGDPKSTTSITSSNSDVNLLLNFKISPNPVSHFINLDRGVNVSSGELSIFSIVGKQMMSNTFKDTDVLKLDVSDLPSGEYILVLYSNGKIGNQKFIKL